MILEIFHYLIGFIIVGILLWILNKTHEYFSKDNKPLEDLLGVKTQ
jgi:putative effector of murein hydrolase